MESFFKKLYELYIKFYNIAFKKCRNTAFPRKFQVNSWDETVVPKICSIYIMWFPFNPGPQFEKHASGAEATVVQI